MAQLVIAEKPSAARKIAAALKGQDVVVVPAVGHLFGLVGRGKGYPIFDVEWKPIFEISKNSAYAKKYFNALKKFAGKVNKIVVATDYDIEGEVIGLNIVRFIFGKADAERMKFSTLTIHDLQKAYFNRSKTLDWGQANAGETRHILDWFYGINLSRAAMAALRNGKAFQILSIGRVQGPALSILAQREREIQSFVPKPFWQIFAEFSFGRAEHEKQRFWDKDEAKRIFEKVRDRPAKLTKIERSIQKVLPPTPFDLTSLQVEAWRVFKIPPKKTLDIAQNLYTAALISYPRTSSQKLPPQIGYKKILSALSKNPKYSSLAAEVLSGSLKPRQGKKTDPAHPAIFPTGEQPKKLSQDEEKIYDLIVKRFFAVFGEPAERETISLKFSIEGEPFIIHLARTTKNGWLKLYSPYLKFKESILPHLELNKFYPQKTTIEEKKTEPPKRYTPASIVAELEKRGLGTKATRAQIIETLYQRGYIFGSPIQVSDLGMKVVEVFKKYAPEIVSEELTRKFEVALEKIRQGQEQKEAVLDRAKEVVSKICAEIDAHQKEIGQGLAEALVSTRKAEEEKRTLMTCPKCGAGKLRVIYSKKTRKRFLACSEYPKCRTTFSLPQKGSLKMLKTKCEKCGANLISVKSRGKRAWKLCINCGVKL